MMPYCLVGFLAFQIIKSEDMRYAICEEMVMG